MKSRLTLAWLTMAVLIVVDLWTKDFVRTHLRNAPPRVVIPGFWDFRYAENRDVGFSLLSAIPHDLRQWFIFAMVGIGLVMVIRYGLTHLEAPRALAGAALIAAGALGNLIDRATHGYVTDFVHWYIKDLHWPVFNVADICVVVGVGLVLWYELPQAQKPAEPA